MRKLLREIAQKVGSWLIFLCTVGGLSYGGTWWAIETFFPEPPASKPFFDMLRIRDKTYDDLAKMSAQTIVLDKNSAPLFNLSTGTLTLSELENFDPKKSAVIENGAIESAILPMYKISFIIVNKQTKVAMIEGKMIKEGDKLGIETVKKIESNRILLQYKASTRWIGL